MPNKTNKKTQNVVSVKFHGSIRPVIVAGSKSGNQYRLVVTNSINGVIEFDFSTSYGIEWDTVDYCSILCRNTEDTVFISFSVKAKDEDDSNESEEDEDDA